jgi:hypothetical protein
LKQVDKLNAAVKVSWFTRMQAVYSNGQDRMAVADVTGVQRCLAAEIKVGGERPLIPRAVVWRSQLPIMMAVAKHPATSHSLADRLPCLKRTSFPALVFEVTLLCRLQIRIRRSCCCWCQQQFCVDLTNLVQTFEGRSALQSSVCFNCGVAGSLPSMSANTMPKSQLLIHLCRSIFAGAYALL